jgi:hypothetical protein
MTEIVGKSSEKTARAALERHGGRALTDTEWERARTALIEFATILRRWGTPAEADDSRSQLPVAA